MPEGHNWFNDAALELPIFRCPSDRGYTGYHLPPWRSSGLSSYDHYGTSYSANALWHADTRPDWETLNKRCEAESLGPMLRPISRVPNPANTVYYMENAGRFAWLYSLWLTSDHYVACLSPDEDPWRFNMEQIKGWHGRTFHFASAFVDGHAGVIEMEGRQWPPPKLASYPVPWSMSGHAESFLRHAYSSYACAVIRGPGWQLDCLPAAMVRSGVPCDLPYGASVVTPMQ